MSCKKMSTWPYAQQMGALDIKLGGWNLYGSALLALWLLCGCEDEPSAATQFLDNTTSLSTQGSGELGLRIK